MRNRPGVLWFQLPLPLQARYGQRLALRDDADLGRRLDGGRYRARHRRGRAIWERILAGPLAGDTGHSVDRHPSPYVDHIGLAAWFQERGPNWTSRNGMADGADGGAGCAGTPDPTGAGLWRAAGMPPETCGNMPTNGPFNASDVCAPLPPGYVRLQDAARGPLAAALGACIWAMVTRPEHVTLWSMDDDLVIGGDQMLATISPNLGVYPTEPGPIRSATGWFLRLAGRFRPARQLILPGHKRPYRGLPTRLRQLADNQRAALDRIEQGLRAGPRSAAGCFACFTAARSARRNTGWRWPRRWAISTTCMGGAGVGRGHGPPKV